MKLQILGCGGGIGGREKLTTCLRVDQDILLDAGTGLASLDVDQLSEINHVFITHSHLDHVAGLALMVDAVLGKRNGAITVYATAPVIAALKKHLFNWVLWPDFSTIPDEADPVMRWQEIAYGDSIRLGDRVITPVPVNHTAGSSGYWIRNERDGFLFTGDMGATPALWPMVAHEKLLSKVIVDCSFTNADQELAEKSRHFCPATLLEEVQALPEAVDILIYHLKPGQEDAIMQELQRDGSRRFAAVSCGDVYEF
jgi:3',5'-cyclic-nucleotide phosphodiesterase